MSMGITFASVKHWRYRYLGSNNTPIFPPPKQVDVPVIGWPHARKVPEDTTHLRIYTGPFTYKKISLQNVSGIFEGRFQGLCPLCSSPMMNTKGIKGAIEAELKKQFEAGKLSKELYDQFKQLNLIIGGNQDKRVLGRKKSRTLSENPKTAIRELRLVLYPDVISRDTREYMKNELALTGASQQEKDKLYKALIWNVRSSSDEHILPKAIFPEGGNPNVKPNRTLTCLKCNHDRGVTLLSHLMLGVQGELKAFRNKKYYITSGNEANLLRVERNAQNNIFGGVNPLAQLGLGIYTKQLIQEAITFQDAQKPSPKLHRNEITPIERLIDWLSRLATEHGEESDACYLWSDPGQVKDLLKKPLGTGEPQLLIYGLTVMLAYPLRTWWIDKQDDILKLFDSLHGQYPEISEGVRMAYGYQRVNNGWAVKEKSAG